MNLTITDLPEIKTLDREALRAVRGGNSIQSNDQNLPVVPPSTQSGNSFTQNASNVSYESNFTPLGFGIPGLFPMLGTPFGSFAG